MPDMLGGCATLRDGCHQHGEDLLFYYHSLGLDNPTSRPGHLDLAIKQISFSEGLSSFL